MNIEEYFGDWLKVIDKKELLFILNKINKICRKEFLCPKQQDVFKAFRLCSLNNLKCIMIGQDPYPQKDVATGVLFGNKTSTKEENLSPSLKIIKEACINFEVPHNSIIFDPTLESWATQGILMLNSSLTTELNKIGSHTMIWRPFIIAFLKHLSKWRTGLIYVLFGKQAQTFKPYINNKFNIILEIEHPAYYARIKEKMPSNLFSTINSLYKDRYGTNVEWYKEY